ncbi:MAG: hypothetical protein V2A79_10250 [Planctomycetota bacterium]
MYKHQRTPFNDGRQIQHFVADGKGRPFLRTSCYTLGGEQEIMVNQWLDQAVALMNEKEKIR